MALSSGPLTVGIVGLGRAARDLHLPALAGLHEGWRVVAGCDSDADARRRFDGPSFEELPAMLTGAKPDVAVIASPPAAHCESAIAALEAGCHVFCEKPVAESVEQFDRMADAAACAGKILAVNSQFPDLKIHRAAAAKIGSPEFGALRLVEINQLFHETPETESGWRGALKHRICFEFGPHVFDLLMTVFRAEPTSIYAQMPMTGEREAANILTLKFPGDRAAVVTLNRLSPGPHRYLDMRLTGERGLIETSIGGEARFEVGVRSTRTPYASVHLSRGGTATLHHEGATKTLATEGSKPFVDATRVRYEELAKAIREDRDLTRGISRQRKIIEVIEAAYRSAETDQAQALE